MVFQALKDMFKQKQVDTTGNLYKNGRIMIRTCKLYLMNDKITFQSPRNQKDIYYNQLLRYEKHISEESADKSSSSLDLGFKVFEFNFWLKDNRNDVYLYIASYDLSSILKELDVFLRPKENVFQSEKTKYLIFDPKNEYFDLKHNECKVLIYKEESENKQNEYSYFLRIDNNGNIVHHEEIDSNNQTRTDPKTKSFVWNITRHGCSQTFCLTFEKNSEFLEFLTKYVTSSGSKDEEVEKQIITSQSRLEDTDEVVTRNHEEKEENEYEYYNATQNNDLSAIFESSSEEDFNKNKAMCVGSDNNVFVSRGNDIGVFNINNDEVKFRVNLKNAINDNGQASGNMLEHNSRLLVLDGNKHDIINIDLHSGKVAETWGIGSTMGPIKDFFGSQKVIEGYCDDPTLIGLGTNVVYRIDPRTKEKVVNSDSKSYKTNNYFSCGMSTRRGDVAIASEKGELRLYDKIDKRAKNLLKGRGDPIISVDVTINGKYIVATCKNYILFYDLSEKDGFVSVLSKDNISREPKVLSLKPEHLPYISEEINFTPAKFSTDTHEKSIVTSTGHFVVSWNIEDVLKGDLYSYNIKKYNDIIIADNFGRGMSDKIIVALEDDIKLVEKRKLKNVKKTLKDRRESSFYDGKDVK